MSERALIRQGDSLVWLARPGTLASGDALSGGWVCLAGVYDAAGAETIAPWTVGDVQTVDGEQHYVVALTSAQTGALDPGRYELVIEIRNDTVTPAYTHESSVVVQVLAERLPR